MADYVTTAEVRAYGYQSLASDDAILAPIITRASRLFDTETRRAVNYFAKGDAGQVASARKFWGRGTDYLKLDPYLTGTITTVTMPAGYTVPTYLEANHNARPELNMPGEFYLIRTYGDNEERSFSHINRYSGGWPESVRVTITAKWGWDAVPDDVKEAVAETVINIWRTRDMAFARAVGVEGVAVINDPLPPRARMIADQYKAVSIA